MHLQNRVTPFGEIVAIAQRGMGRKRLHPADAAPRDLPDGTFVAIGDAAFTLRAGPGHRWTDDGYDQPRVLDRADWM